MTNTIPSIKQAIEDVFRFETNLVGLILAAGPLPKDPLQAQSKLENKTLTEITRIVTQIDFNRLFVNNPAGPAANNNPLYPSEVQQFLQPTSRIMIYNTRIFTALNTLIQRATDAVKANYVFLRILCQYVPYLVSFCDFFVVVSEISWNWAIKLVSCFWCFFWLV
jgi:hypothetical protein